MTLKVDVDTLRGTREGAPRLARLFKRLGLPATFLFSLGPDHTGRAIRRVFRRGFLGKVRRTSVASHYGIRTLLYGTLLPGPDIGRLCTAEMLRIADERFEVGVHAYDHVKWQDGVTSASLEWTREQLGQAVRRFEKIFGLSPLIHGAAGWQVNEHVPMLERQLGFEVASDTRGRGPFLPAGGGVLQLPTTLPTLDELLGMQDRGAEGAMQRLMELTRPEQEQSHVFTLHAELEGGAFIAPFESLLRSWLEQGFTFCTLGDQARALNGKPVALGKIEHGEIEGRSGTLAVQGRFAAG